MSDQLNWKVISKKEVGNYEVFRVSRVTACANSNQMTKDFHIVDREPCVQTIAQLEDGRVILVKQFRIAINRVSLEFPAGSTEPGEDPVAAGLRELEEETGYRADRFEKLGVVDTDTALVNEGGLTIVAAYGCTPSGERNLDEGEIVEVELYTPAQVDDLIRSGRITLASAIAAWHLFRSRPA